MAEAIERHVLCCACPGSGKTRVLVHRARHILQEQPGARIVMVTFSREASEEMQRRVGRHGRVRVGSFHALALAQLRQAGLARKIVSGYATRQMVQDALAECSVDLDTDLAVELVARYKTEPDFAAANPALAPVVEVYRRQLAERNGCDFTDLMVDAVEAMQNGRLAPIRAEHFLCDEFQDIDAIQYRWLMAHLAQPSVSCAVGDDDQSIYGFRRALGYRGMQAYASAVGARTVVLDTNYRSTGAIIAAATALIRNNPDRIAKSMHASRGGGIAPRIRVLANDHEQDRQLLADLTAICHGQAPEADGQGQPMFRFGVRPGQVAVLARTNALLRDANGYLRRNRVPTLRLGVSIWNMRVAQVFAGLLESLADGSDHGIELALRWARQPEATVRRLAAGGKLHPALRGDGPCPPGLGPVATAFFPFGRAAVRTFAGKGASAAEVAARISALGTWMRDVLRGTCGQDPDTAADTVANAKYSDYALTEMDTIDAVRDLLVRLPGAVRQRLLIAQRQREDKVGRVVLTTFHGAKGLEWDHVIILDASADVVPKCIEGTEEELAEERRLFYVGLTRARDDLHIYTRTGAESLFLSEAFPP